MGMPVPYQGDIRCCLCLCGCWGPPRYLCGWSTAPSIQVKNLVENLTVFFSSWFAMGEIFFRCVHVYTSHNRGVYECCLCPFFFSFQLTYFLFVDCFSLYFGMVSVQVVVFVPFTDHIG